MTLKEIKRAVTAVLKKAYPNQKIYAADTTEGYEKPSFFVYVTQTFSESTKNATHKNVEVEIDYIQSAPDESDGMDFFAKMEQVLSQKLPVGSRMLTIDHAYGVFQGENRNIPCFTFEVEFWDGIEREQEDAQLMGELKLRQELK